MEFFVYILECSDKTYYIGSTNNIKRRLHQHNHLKSGAHYTKLRRPTHLKYVEKFSTLLEARRREISLKKLERKEKKQLCMLTSAIMYL